MAETITKTIVVNRPVDEIYNLWRNFDNFPYFMENIREVRRIDDLTSHWIMEGPMGRNVEWDAKTTAQDRNERIAWASTRGDIDTNGQVRFKQLGNNQTEVTVVLQYDVKSTVGEALAKMFDNPSRKLETDLHNFKRYAEEGHRLPGVGERGGRGTAGFGTTGSTGGGFDTGTGGTMGGGTPGTGGYGGSTGSRGTGGSGPGSTGGSFGGRDRESGGMGGTTGGGPTSGR